jgi:hypothetical protein
MKKDIVKNDGPTEADSPAAGDFSQPLGSALHVCDRCGNEYNAHQCPVCWGYLGPVQHDPNELMPGTKLQAGDEIRWGGAWRYVCQDFEGMLMYKEPHEMPIAISGIRYRRPNAEGTNPDPTKP